jgi:cell division protein FtsI/penicillin-binding protein 2
MTSATTYGRRARTTVPLPSALSRRSGDWDASAPAALTGTGSLVLVQFLTLVVALVLIGRLGWWQVVESARLTQRLEAQKLLDQPLPATRGAIRDTNGELLAGNLGAAFICAFPSQVRRPEDAAAKLAPVLGVSTQSILDALANTSASYVRLNRGARVDQQVADQVAALRIGGIVVEPATKRTYPERALAGQVIGFVDFDGHGRYGIEGQWNEQLTGTPGRLRSEKDTEGHEIGIGIRDLRPPVDGLDTYLTLDRTIQYIAERELERAVIDQRADGGTVIVMNPRTGAILAMANRPSFDPNRYEEVATTPDIFQNPAISGTYEPGSTFKIVTMAAGIEEKVITPETVIDDSGILTLGGFTIRNWDRKANGRITMTQALERSSNIAAASVAQRLGVDRFQRYVGTFGFGTRTGIDLQGEEIGIVKRVGTAVWSQTDVVTNAYGQGIAVTPIQMAVAMSTIANGGIMMRPHVVQKVIDSATGQVVSETRPQIVRQAISRDASAAMLQMLFRSAENGETRGTLVPGFQAAGKTGTASIPTNGVYSEDETIASFVGAVPANDPQFVILVKIDRPRVEPWGSLVAKPVFAMVGQEVSRYLRLARTEPIPPAVTTAEAKAMARALTTPTETSTAVVTLPRSTPLARRSGEGPGEGAPPQSVQRREAGQVGVSPLSGNSSSPGGVGLAPSPSVVQAATRTSAAPTPTGVPPTSVPLIPSPTANFAQLRATATALASTSARERGATSTGG